MAAAEERLAARMSVFDRRLEQVDRVARELDRVLENATDAQLALHGALAQLPDHQRRLAQAEQILGELEQRALEARTNLEQHLEAFDEAARRLHERTLSDVFDLDRRFHDADLKKGAIDQVIAGAAQILSSLQAHFARIPDAERDVANAVRGVAELEERAGAAGLDLERRLLTFDTHRASIDSAIATATQATAVLSELDRRVAALSTGESSSLARADAHIGHLEEMAAATTADLKRLTHARNLLKHELAHLQVDVKKVTKAADNDARTLERMRKQTVVLREELSELANDTSTLAASLPRRTSRVEQLRRLHSPGVLLIVALVAAMAFTALGLRTRRVETRTRVSEPVPMLSSRPLPASPLLILVTAAAPSPIVSERQPTAIVPDRRLPRTAVARLQRPLRKYLRPSDEQRPKVGNLGGA
jgi:hypothetical protein